MGKTPDDLPLDDHPLVRPAPVDDRDTDWYKFAAEIEALIDGGQYDWALDTLQGIRQSVLDFKVVTVGQRQAIANIEAARGRADGWRRRRYEGFGGRQR
jgi:hypothetical protein